MFTYILMLRWLNKFGCKNFISKISPSEWRSISWQLWMTQQKIVLQIGNIQMSKEVSNHPSFLSVLFIFYCRKACNFTMFFPLISLSNYNVFVRSLIANIILKHSLFICLFLKKFIFKWIRLFKLQMKQCLSDS